MKIFVAGASGQLAQSLVGAAAVAPNVEVLAVGRPTLELCDPDSIARTLDRAEADLVVNAAAYTAVDRAESEPELAHAVNADGAGMLAELAATLGLPVVHISTDYVFDGCGQRLYRETDTPNPINVYGGSKLAGEQQVAAANRRHLILRTSWTYSPYGHNFVKTMLRLASERPELKVVADQFGSPTFAEDLAVVVLAVCGRLAGGDAVPWGTYHVAGTGSASRHELAEFVIATAASCGWPPAVVRPVNTAEIPMPARRPASSGLDCSKLARVFGLSLPPWKDGVARCLARILASARTGRAGSLGG
jgi:dTDP-4-dehydrorhamnose reductase